MTHKLFLTTRQTTKLRNAFANNISTNIKVSKAQLFNIIQSSRSFRSWLANFGKKALINITISLPRDNLLELVSNLTSSAINKFEREIVEK